MKKSGRALVGIMVAAVIALLLTFVFLNGSSIFPGTKQEPERADKQGKTLVGKSILKAKDTVCLEQLQEDRQMIQLATDPVEDTKPASLSAAKVTGDLARCPIGHEPYVYDPATGTIHCVHPGHEKY